jgi:hypothetical protein
LCNAPSTEREFNVLRTAVEWTFAFRVELGVTVRVKLGVVPTLGAALCSTERLGVAWTATDRLLGTLGRPAERDIAGLALM